MCVLYMPDQVTNKTVLLYNACINEPLLSLAGIDSVKVVSCILIIVPNVYLNIAQWNVV